jgi:hypothetical protein
MLIDLSEREMQYLRTLLSAGYQLNAGVNRYKDGLVRKLDACNKDKASNAVVISAGHATRNTDLGITISDLDENAIPCFKFIGCPDELPLSKFISGPYYNWSNIKITYNPASDLFELSKRRGNNNEEIKISLQHKELEVLLAFYIHKSMVARGLQHEEVTENAETENIEIPEENRETTDRA